jgi:integrase
MAQGQAPAYSPSAALPADLAALTRFLSLTSWRIGEALALRWGQVDFEAGVIRLDPGSTKNGEGRTFPFGLQPELVALIEEQRARTRSAERDQKRIIPLVFHVQGDPIWLKRFYRQWWKAAKAAEVYREWTDPRTGKVKRGPIPHDFRRTVVRNFERAGVPRSVAVKLTGHKTEAVYRRYAIVSEADLAEGVKKLAAMPSRTMDRRAGVTAG